MEDHEDLSDNGGSPNLLEILSKGRKITKEGKFHLMKNSETYRCQTVECLDFLRTCQSHTVLATLVPPLPSTMDKRSVSKVVVSVYDELESYDQSELPDNVKGFLASLSELVATKESKAIKVKSSMKQFTSSYNPDLTPMQSEMQTCFKCSHKFMNQEFPNDYIREQSNCREKCYQTKYNQFKQSKEYTVEETGEIRKSKPRRSTFKFDLLCFCCTINCGLSNNCPLCKVNKPEAVLSDHGVLVCPCEICSCTCTLAVEQNQFRKALEEHHQLSQIKKRTIHEIKEGVIPNLSQKLQRVFEKDSLELPIDISQDEQNILAEQLPLPSIITPLKNNINSCFSSSSFSPLPSLTPSLANSSSSASASFQGPSDAEKGKSLPFIDQICRELLNKTLNPDIEKEDKVKLHNLFKKLAKRSSDIIQDINEFFQYAPFVVEGEELSQSQLDQLLSHLTMN